MTDTNGQRYEGEERDLHKVLAGAGQETELDGSIRTLAEKAYKTGDLPLLRVAGAAMTEWYRAQPGGEGLPF